MWPERTRPHPRPEVYPTHVSRRGTAGRSTMRFVFTVTRCPTPACGSPRAFVAMLLNPWLVWCSWLVPGRLRACRYSHSDARAIMRRSMPVPATPYKPRLAPWRPRRRSQLSVLWQSESPADARRHSLRSERNKLPPGDARLHCCCHTTTQRAHRCDQGHSMHAGGVDFISLPPIPMQEKSHSSTKPVETFRFRGVSASVFENQTDDGKPFHKVSLVRTYRDGKDFRTTNTFSRDELPLVMLVAKSAYEFVLSAERDNREHADK